MTNKEDCGERCDTRVAALLAVHLVSQVLDEAYIIANAAKDSGQPWRYLSMLKNFRSSRLSETVDEDMSFGAARGDSEMNENKTELVANVIATSTPQKVSGVTISDELKHKNDSNFIGQGDEEFELSQNELNQSTSMYISQLFDMSEVERVLTCDENDHIQANASPVLLAEAMSKIMESNIKTALDMTFGQEILNIDSQIEPKLSRSTKRTDYSFLADAFVTNVGKDIGFYIDNEASFDNENNFEAPRVTPVVEVTEQIDQTLEENTTDVKRDDVAFYENAYLTLNRDYDQCSENDEDPILQDPKGLIMQEVELLTTNTSDDNVFSFPEPEKKSKDLGTASAMSAAASGSRTSSLVRRCRTQGARLLACLRGWWRRKAPGNRKKVRLANSARGLCPLSSPDARRRASSLLDHRLLRSPSPSRPVDWKFNTVNEALVKSSRWKEYTFEAGPDVYGEF